MSGEKPLRIKSVDVVESEEVGEEDYVVVYLSRPVEGKVSAVVIDVSDIFDLAKNFGKPDTIPDGRKEEPVIYVDGSELFGEDEEESNDDPDDKLEEDVDEILDADFQVKREDE